MLFFPNYTLKYLECICWGKEDGLIKNSVMMQSLLLSYKYHDIIHVQKGWSLYHDPVIFCHFVFLLFITEVPRKCGVLNWAFVTSSPIFL